MGELMGYVDQITSYGFSSTDLGNKATRDLNLFTQLALKGIAPRLHKRSEQGKQNPHKPISTKACSLASTQKIRQASYPTWKH